MLISLCWWNQNPLTSNVSSQQFLNLWKSHARGYPKKSDFQNAAAATMDPLQELFRHPCHTRRRYLHVDLCSVWLSSGRGMSCPVAVNVTLEPGYCWCHRAHHTRPQFQNILSHRVNTATNTNSKFKRKFPTPKSNEGCCPVLSLDLL